jgi:hypothetical protein
MKFRFSILSLMTFLLSGCSSLYPSRVDNRNFAVDTYQLHPRQIQAAETRAVSFWRKNAARYGADPTLLAVEASSVNAIDLGVPFSAKVDHSDTTASYFNHGVYSDAQTVTCVMIFDTKTNHLLGRNGYIFVDTPSIGTVIHVESLVARYIGRGG